MSKNKYICQYLPKLWVYCFDMKMAVCDNCHFTR